MNKTFKKSSLVNKLYQGYKQLSAKSLSVAVTPTVLGELPTANNVPTFYVLDEYSRANSLLLQNQISAHQKDRPELPDPLSAVSQAGIAESSALIFLKHRRAKSELSPRLVRLVQACLDDPQLDVHLVPTIILWGRQPEKEESLFKLLMADEWRAPSISKQLFNIGVMGRDTFVQFYRTQSLQRLIAESAVSNGDVHEIVKDIQLQLKGYLRRQKTSVLGPDLSDKRNITINILQSKPVQDAIVAKAYATNKPINTIKKEAESYVDEIASDYSYSVVRVFDRFLTWLWTQLYDGVNVRHFDRVRALAPDYQIIYVPCHRSHMDYLLLSYVIFTRGLRVPHVAAGANLNIPILGELLRSGGAFFLRRSFRDNPLYGTVFKEYLHNLMQRAAPIEYFIEGGRSRSGRLLAPKLGMLAMTVSSYLREPAKPVVFIPTYIGYERIMEGATYVGELKGKSKESENLLGLIKTAKKIERIFGTVHLSFGEPLYLSDFMEKFNISHADDVNARDYEDKLSAMIANLGVKIMQHINRTAVVNPVSLLALALLSTPKAALDKAQLFTNLQLYQTIANKLPYDADVDVTNMTPSQIVVYGEKLRLTETSHHPLGSVIRVAKNQAPLLSYFKNNILHLFIMPSLLAALVQKNNRIHIDNLRQISELLYPFLQSEFFLKIAKRNIHKLISEAVQVLTDEGVFIDLGDGVIASADGNSANYQKLDVLASPAKQSLERYFMAITFLSEQGSGTMSAEQVVNLCHAIGERLSVLYGEDLPDSFDKALYSGFVNTLIRTEYVRADDEGLLHFDERLESIARFAKFALNVDTLNLLQQATKLPSADIDAIGHKDKHKFRSKPKRRLYPMSDGWFADG